MDSAGDQHLHIDHNIFKRRYDLEGNPIEEAKKEEIMTTTTVKVNTVRIRKIPNDRKLILHLYLFLDTKCCCIRR